MQDIICLLYTSLGNPQDDLKYVHIAGTNGKGSVSAFFKRVFQVFSQKKVRLRTRGDVYKRQKALRKLRHPSRSRKLKDYLD